jgi:hypothetical protein
LDELVGRNLLAESHLRSHFSSTTLWVSDFSTGFEHVFEAGVAVP